MSVLVLILLTGRAEISCYMTIIQDEDLNKPFGVTCLLQSPDEHRNKNELGMFVAQSISVSVTHSHVHFGAECGFQIS